ncbi:MAG TPA: porin family protein [Bacteroidia bacterium]|nr:porin family protein [Bacteroidia bacterium]
MKKALILLLTLTLGASYSFAQDDENNLKNFRFGLVASPSLNWYKPEDSKKLENNGLKGGFAWGLQMEFRLNKVASLVTGLQVSYDRGNMLLKDTANFFYDTQEEGYLALEDTAGKSFVTYKLNNRIYKTNYVTLPLYLKMKTNEIGMMTYFGEFGLNSSFRLKSKTTDDVTQYSSGNPKSTLEDVDNTKDMNILRFSLHIGGGFEYNISGSTSMFVGIAFNYGFSNVFQKESEYLMTNANPVAPFKQQATANNIALSVGILF